MQQSKEDKPVASPDQKERNSTSMKANKIVILGASPNPDRHSYSAVARLYKKGYKVIPIGIRPGHIEELEILTGQPSVEGVHTISLYIGTPNQPPLYEYILKLNPERLIFNPGTENFELAQLAEKNGIKTEMACTLVMIATDQI